MSVYVKEKPEFLRQSLESVFNQTLEPDEVILVQDGPLTPELDGVIADFQRRYPSLRTLPLEKNGGLGRALDQGLHLCSNDLVARMDTDDICFPDRFSRQVAFMDSHPDVDVASGWIDEFIGTVDNVRSVKRVPASNEEILVYMRKRNPMNHPAVMFRKAAVLEAGGYMHFPLFEDWYLWARMSQKGRRFANMQESLLYFRMSPEAVKRRGGWKYSKDSARFQMKLHEIGLISLPQALVSATMRSVVYLMPNRLRTLVYSKLLRK